MSDSVPIRIRGREITFDVLEFVRETIAAHWSEGRSAISRILCEHWNWRQPNGRVKDMACRDLLLRLERLELIALPPRQSKKANYKRIHPLPSAFEEREAQPLQGCVDAFRSLHLKLVRGSAQEPIWDSLVARYHYLGCRTIVGGYLKYFVHLDGHLVACLGWGSAAWKVRCRDQFIGWAAEQRQQRLSGLANNVRFLILPWIQVQHLASKTLSLSARVLPLDWQRMFDEKLYLLETFVDQVKEHKLKRCPDCQTSLRGKSACETRTRYTEEIPQTRFIVIEHRIYRYYCRVCDKIVEEPVTDALPNSTIDLRTLVFSA